MAEADTTPAQVETGQNIETVFQKEGQVFEVSGNTPLLLNTSDYVWFVNAGTVDIFTVRIENGQVVGARTHFLRLQPGDLFFGIDSGKYGKDQAFLAVGTIGSRVFRLDVARVQQLSREQAVTAVGIGDRLDQWVTALTKVITPGLIPQDAILLQANQDIQLEENLNFTAEKEVLWIQHQAGASKPAGSDRLPRLEGTDFFPVSKQSWLQTTGAVQLHVASIQECIPQDLFWRSLEKFHLCVLDFVILTIKEYETREQLRLQEKAREETNAFMNAMAKLSGVIKAKKEQDVLETVSDPLLQACQAIGQYVGITLKPHPDSKKGLSKDPLRDIARASRVRIRKIILSEKWWTQDNSAFLAYKTEGKRPVALIPNHSTSYRLIDPVEGTIPKVTKKIAESLDGVGYTFYRPFPNHPLTAKDVAKFSFRGLGKELAVIFTVATLGALLGLLLPTFMGKIFNEVIPASDRGQLMQLTIILVAATLTTTFFEITKAIGLLRLEGKLDYAAQSALWDRLLALPVPFFRDYTAGDLAVRSLGINGIRQILSGTVIQSVFAGIFSLMYFGLLFSYSKQLALVATALSFASVLCTVCIGYYFVRYQKPLQEIEGKISGLLLQLLSGINKLRITGTEDRAFVLWTKEFSAQKTMAVKSKTIQNVLKVINTLLPVIASMVIFSWVVFKLQENELNTGDFMAFSSAYGSFQAALIQMSIAFLTALGAVPLYTRLRPILEAEVEVDEAKSSPGQLEGHIEVNQVNFRYKADGPLILHDISLKIHPGEFVAFVGSSGSGKSTLMRMLLGFERPESGTIYFDGKDIETVDVREVRQQIGVVLQNSRIMPGSILDNIIGSSTLTIDDAWEAARMAGCETDIQEMPMQMHTFLPPGGGTLSGGQRQRILIARSIVKKPRILIFDEATSALDNRTQEIVSRSIEQLKSTRIVIAHRLSTIMHADHIYVMEKGRLVQDGAYEELMKQPGLFAELAKRQIA